MPSRFPFKSAVCTGETGQSAPLKQVLADFHGSTRRPLRLHLRQRGRGSRKDTTIALIEMSRAEAFAFSEWLDSVVTRPPSRRRDEPAANPEGTPPGA